MGSTQQEIEDLQRKVEALMQENERLKQGSLNGDGDESASQSQKGTRPGSRDGAAVDAPVISPGVGRGRRSSPDRRRRHSDSTSSANRCVPRDQVAPRTHSLTATCTLTHTPSPPPTLHTHSPAHALSHTHSLTHLDLEMDMWQKRTMTKKSGIN